MRLTVTEDIYLEFLQEKDSQELFYLIEDNRLLLEKYLYWAKSVQDMESTKQYICQRIYSKHNGSAWHKIIFNDQLSGIIGVKEIDQKNKCAEIGYWLSAHCQGKGVMAKVVAKICEELKRQAGVAQIKIHCLSENTASIAVARRAGGIHSSTIPAYLTIDGKSQDLMIYTVAL
ncbi:GNAT family N-acetyltransferase [Microbulbifer sp. VAAC004]|uniref:GNAT family N-acetyltransferase n=1 Tax=Microbulbifer variabilis TaxID=266805 RepID=A0ABY4VAS9_9GAMM|nr:GNAT family protein [Microbulbifer variabilis]USD21344.1 GNAT family N-acetyltransferase [Microbulbifer variabilis]